MKANKLKLNPGADISGTLVCSHCGEEVKEVSYEDQNVFICGCEKPVEFEIPTLDETEDEHSDELLDDELLDARELLDDYDPPDITDFEELDSKSLDLDDGDCRKCGGSGMTTIFLGQTGGAVECDRCDGTGEEPYINT